MLTKKFNSFIIGVVAACAIFSAAAQGVYSYTTIPSATDFAQEKIVGSAPIPVIVTITNTFAYKKQLGFGASIVGDANWQQTFSTCLLSTALAYGASCIIQGVYTPKLATNASTLTLQTTAGAGMRGQQVILHTVVKNGKVTVEWTKPLPANSSLDTTYTVEATVTNSSATAVTLSIPTWTKTPAEDFAEGSGSGNCSNSLDSGKSCSYSQTFKPINASTATNDKKLDITVNYNANQTATPTAATTTTTHPTLIAVGSGPGNSNKNGARILVSKDQGTTWQVNSYNTITSLKSIIANSNQLLTFGENGAVMTSPNGDEWTLRNTGTSFDLQTGIWDATKYLVYGLKSDNTAANILTSTDSQTWSSSPLTPPKLIQSVLKRDNSYAALAMDTSLHSLFLTSNDGLSWTDQYDFTAQAAALLLGQLIWDGTHYIAVGYSRTTNSGASYKSTDGTDWTAYPIANTSRLIAVNWNGSQYVAVGVKGTVLTSTDAQTWTAQQSHVQGDLKTITWDGSQYLAAGAGTIIKSGDGITWSVVNSGADTHLNSIAWNGSRYVAVGGYEYVDPNLATLLSVSSIITSTDGVNWSQATTVPSNAKLNSVAYGNHVFVAVGARGTVLRSSDGLTWTQITTFTDEDLNAVIWSTYHNKFFVVGNDGAFYSSANGNDWTPITTGASVNLNTIAEHNGTCVIVLTSAPHVMYSNNCNNTWTNPSTPPANDALQIAYIDNQFISVGHAGEVYSSATGQSWIQHAFPVSGIILFSIAKLGDSYLISASNGKIYKSTSLDNWTEVDLQNNMQLNGIVIANNKATVVGNNGVIFNSADGTDWTAAQNFNIYLSNVYAKTKSST
jgi:hypothetical protein